MVERINRRAVTLVLMGAIGAGIVTVAVSYTATKVALSQAAYAQRAQDAIARKGFGDVYAGSRPKSQL